jgi:hypothetical protein
LNNLPTDSTELIETCWASKHEIEKDEISIVVNLVQVTNSNPKVVYKRKPICNYQQFLLLISLIFTSIIRISTAFLFEENFKYCEIHDNRAVWNLPKGYQTTLAIQPIINSKFHIRTRKVMK